MKLYQVSQVKHKNDFLYICPYCKWVFWSRQYVVDHMKYKCVASPEAAGCATCGHKQQNEDGKWICGDGQIDGILFSGPGSATTGCCRHFLDETHTDGCYYTRSLAVGALIKPKGYYKTYRVDQIWNVDGNGNEIDDD